MKIKQENDKIILSLRVEIKEKMHAYTQATLEFTRLDTQAWHSEVVVHGRSLPPISVSVYDKIFFISEWALLFLRNCLYSRVSVVDFVFDRG
ncbi:MAG: hypothetical protein LBJ00_10305 [Planctomycetaceae bacterium]|jgi:hypothetical protein|nr:hypothetical protein [Planctomycetaceae bacterium]